MKSVVIKPYGKVLVKEDTQLILDFSNPLLTAKNKDLEISIEEEGIAVEILGAYTLVNEETINVDVKITHKVPNTSCTTLIKGVLYDETESHFLGTIKIPKKAQKTDAALSHKVITLGEKCKNESQPILNIEANDVKATHGSTTGAIDKNQLYYLESRGLTKDQAEKIILEGFFASLLDKIGDEDIKLKVASNLRINL